MKWYISNYFSVLSFFACDTYSFELLYINRWSMIMIVITSHICRERELGRLYAEVAQILQIFQTAAILEVNIAGLP